MENGGKVQDINALRGKMGAKMAGKKRAKPAGGETPEFLTVREAMARLRLSRCAMYRALERGDIPSMRIGKLYRIPAAWLELEAGREGTKPGTE